MKKILMLATVAFLTTGIAFAHGGDKKKCAKGKECCKKDKEGKEACNDSKKKDSKTATVKTTAKKAA